MRVVETVRDDGHGRCGRRQGGCGEGRESQHAPGGRAHERAVGGEGHAARLLERNRARDASVRGIDDHQAADAGRTDDQRLVEGGEPGEVIAPVDRLVVHAGATAFRIARWQRDIRPQHGVRGLAADGSQIQGVSPDRRRIGLVGEVSSGAGVAGECGGARPGAKRCQPRELVAIEVGPDEAMAALGHSAADQHERLCTWHEKDVARRLVVRQPLAPSVGRAPRRIDRVVNRELVTQVDLPAHEAAHAVLARLDQPAVHLVGTVGSLVLGAMVVEPVPPHGVFTGREGRFADQVSHAVAGCILDHERHEAGGLEREADRDRRVWLFGGEFPHDIGRASVSERRQHDRIAEPRAPAADHPCDFGRHLFTDRR